MNEVITFHESNNSISSYETIPCPINTSFSVEFFPGKITKIFLISNESETLKNLLDEIDDGKNIAIDLEWEKELSLLQLCSSHFCLLIRLISHENDQILIDFLNNHYFYGKGMHNDKKMLLRYFGSSFSKRFEDISTTRLSPYNLSQNFNEMTKKFAGEPTTNFKVIEMTKSDWSLNELSYRQVFYAAFDVVALFYCYPNFPPPKMNDSNKSKPKKEIKTFNHQNNENLGENNMKNRAKSKGKTQKMNLSVVFKPREMKKEFFYLINNYQGITDKIILRKIFSNIDFISSFCVQSYSFLFIGSFSPIYDFSPLFVTKNSYDANDYSKYFQKTQDDNESIENKSNNEIDENSVNKEICFSKNEFQNTRCDNKMCNGKENIELSVKMNSFLLKEPIKPMEHSGITEIGKDIFLLPFVPFELCNDTDVLFIDKLPSIISDEKILEDLIYCFGFDHLLGKIGSNSCRIEPRNAELSRRIRTFIPFININQQLMELYEYPTFIPTTKITNIPSTFTTADMEKIFPTMTHCEFILKRNKDDRQTALVKFSTSDERNSFISKYNHVVLENDIEELLMIPYTDDVHLRYIRSYELTVDCVNKIHGNNLKLSDIYQIFGQYGNIIQVNFDKRFNNFHVLFYRKCDAIKAHDEINKTSEKTGISTFFHPDGSTIIVRDLPMDVQEHEVIGMFSSIGEITNLVFRDLTPMNILSVVDIFMNSKEDAQEAKRKMNKIKVHNTSIHVSIRMREDMADWKMSQRNQWIKFEPNQFSSLAEIKEKTIKYGKIIDYNYYNDHFLIMLDDQDQAKLCTEELNASLPTYQEFVNETNNSNELEIIKRPSIPGNPTGPKECAILIDPIPDSMTVEFIESILKENTSDLEISVGTSVKYSPYNRLVIYSPSNKVTKKVYTLLVNSEFEGSYLRPQKVDVEDLEDPPPKKKHIVKFEGYEVRNPVVIVDPLPDEYSENDVRDLITDLKTFEMIICGSSITPLKRRAVIFPKQASERRIIIKALSQKIHNNGYLHVYKVKYDSIPPSL